MEALLEHCLGENSWFRNFSLDKKEQIDVVLSAPARSVISCSAQTMSESDSGALQSSNHAV